MRNIENTLRLHVENCVLAPMESPVRTLTNGTNSPQILGWYFTWYFPDTSLTSLGLCHLH